MGVQTAGQWKHFSDVCDWLAMGPLSFGADFADLIEQSPKFFIPEAGDLSLGRNYEELKPFIKLPFPTITTLRNTRMNDETIRHTGQGFGRVVTIFFDPHEAINIARRIIPEAMCPMPSWVGLAMTGVKGLGWTCLPPSPFLIDGSVPGFQLRLLATREIQQFKDRYGWNHDQSLKELHDEVSALVETCMLLNCVNVERRLIRAPKFLNKKRICGGKRPLFDYHVLRVDGESWDSDGTCSTHGAGVRSHFRRGHFRHIQGTRLTWVRATLVHGSVTGFVHKDYDVRHA